MTHTLPLLLTLVGCWLLVTSVVGQPPPVPAKATLEVYAPIGNQCVGQAPYPFSVTYESGVCSNQVPDPWSGSGGSGYSSVNLTINAETNYYYIQLFNGPNCTEDETDLGGQGSACEMEGFYTPFQVISPIIAPCTYTMYADDECSTTIVNQFGMTPNTCVSSILANSLQIDVNQQDYSFLLTGFQDYHDCGSEQVFQISGQLQVCTNNATLTCNFQQPQVLSEI